jgi:hypothetical protein
MKQIDDLVIVDKQGQTTLILQCRQAGLGAAIRHPMGPTLLFFPDGPFFIATLTTILALIVIAARIATVAIRGDKLLARSPLLFHEEQLPFVGLLDH